MIVLMDKNKEVQARSKEFLKIYILVQDNLDKMQCNKYNQRDISKYSNQKEDSKRARKI